MSSNKEIKPSRMYYGLASVVLVLGVALFVQLLLSGIGGITKGMSRVVVPGKERLLLSKLGSYKIFHEYRSILGKKVHSVNKRLPSGFRCSLLSVDTGKEIRLHRVSGKATYSLGSRAGFAVFDFTIDKPGVYELTGGYEKVKSQPTVVLTVGRGFMKQLLITILGAIAILLGTLAGVILIIALVFVKRKKAKEELEKLLPF